MSGVAKTSQPRGHLWLHLPKPFHHHGDHDKDIKYPTHASHNLHSTKREVDLPTQLHCETGLIITTSQSHLTHHPNTTHIHTHNMGSLPDYSLPPQEITFDGFLFDMDGTIIDSTEAVVKHWET